MTPQSGEKTEKATPRKRRQAREDGQVLKSTEVVTALALFMLFGTLSIFSSFIIDGLKGIMVDFFGIGSHMPDTISKGYLSHYFLKAFLKAIIIVLPIFAAALVAAFVSNFVQIGFLYSPKAMQPKMERINMIDGFKRIFSKNSLIQLLKSIIKIVLLGVIAYNEYKKHVDGFPNLMWLSVSDGAAYVWDLLINVAFKVSMAFAIIAPLDYFYEWFRFEKNLMMTKQEIKEEYRLTEGDPQIRGVIRQRQRQMSGMRMMNAVPEADVVIVNPTRYAIAVAYDQEENEAPVIIAKGRDHIAQKIRDIAEESKIEIVQNREVARALYFYCEVGDEVPEDLYQAVAEILAYVYRLKNEVRRRRR